MNDTVIKVENISKEYRLGTISHGTLYRDLQSWSAKLLGKEDPNSKITSDGTRVENGTFKALDNISFMVKQGDVLGVIGRNGAGKSTLLKIISQVTAPSSGTIKIKGRVASLLEVGTGFHPELTGRENVFLNGAILGMSKDEIRRKFDEIVAFSEVEKFIDTPVKRYSSGMYVRLAFAVAAHLEPEILIIDEVLAVGDAPFQKKCLGKMEEVGKEGRTVLFVSHNMGAISRLCKTCIYLRSGQVVTTGPASQVVEQYMQEGFSGQEADVSFSGGENDDIQFVSARLEHVDNTLGTIFRSDEDVRVLVTYKVKRPLAGVSLVINITTGEQESLWSMGDWEQHPQLLDIRDPGIWTGEWVIPANVLRPGRYFIACGAGSPSSYFHHPEPFPFEISVEGTWRPAFRQFGVSGGPMAMKMDVKPPVFRCIIDKTSETI